MSQWTLKVNQNKQSILPAIRIWKSLIFDQDDSITQELKRSYFFDCLNGSNLKGRNNQFS